MKNTNIRKLNIDKSLKYWQRRLCLTDWQIDFKFKKFTRTDFIQSGDIDVDTKTKKATVLISDSDTGHDSYTVLHELVHLVLWDVDHYAESKIAETDKGNYFDLLENTVKKLTDVFFVSDKSGE